jgi:phytoene/squalene synthetase
MRKHDVDPHQIFAGKMSEGLRAIINEIADAAKKHLAVSRSGKIHPAKEVLPALWPASLSDLYLKQITAPSFNPFTDPTELPVFRRQLRLLGRKLTGHF